MLIENYFNRKHEILEKLFNDFIVQTLEDSNIIDNSIEHIASEEFKRA